MEPTLTSLSHSLSSSQGNLNDFDILPATRKKLEDLDNPEEALSFNNNPKYQTSVKKRGSPGESNLEKFRKSVKRNDKALKDDEDEQKPRVSHFADITETRRRSVQSVVDNTLIPHWHSTLFQHLEQVHQAALDEQNANNLDTEGLDEQNNNNLDSQGLDDEKNNLETKALDKQNANNLDTDDQNANNLETQNLHDQNANNLDNPVSDDLNTKNLDTEEHAEHQSSETESCLSEKSNSEAARETSKLGEFNKENAKAVDQASLTSLSICNSISSCESINVCVAAVNSEQKLNSTSAHATSMETETCTDATAGEGEGQGIDMSVN